MEDFIVSFHLSSCLFLLPHVYVSVCQLLKQDRTVNVFYTFFRQTVRQAMEMLSGAEMVVRSLIDQGVKQVFGYPEARSLIFTMHCIPWVVSIMF